MNFKLVHIIPVIVFSSIIIGCAKEYSYQARPVIPDSLVVNTPAWTCPDCVGRDSQIVSRWSFHHESSLRCGMIDTARVNAERTAFTFFGPYACSADTGIIISAYLDGNVLNKDLFNISTQNGAFYFYDNIAPSTILISHSANFNVVVESYIHQTRIMTGKFSGIVYYATGATSYISDGKFKVIIP
jgi:hypothetical protein